MLNHCPAMYNLSEEEIDFILDDLRAKGIENDDLRDSLLDHICIILEQEMSENDDFKEHYSEILPRFFKDELSEIQTETNNLLRFKHFYAMKKTLKIVGLLTAIFTVIGAILKTFHLPGAGVMIVLGGFFLSFIFLPLLIVIKFRDEDSKTDKAVFGIGFTLAMTLSVGLIFKLMHWPGANILMIGSTVLFTFGYVPLYFFTRFNRPEIRFNTIVNSVLMLACGGIFFSLFDLSMSHSYSKQMVQNHKFIHNHAERLFDSNNRLIAANNESKAQELHLASNRVNDQIEIIAEMILSAKNIKPMIEESSELRVSINEYNSLVGSIESTDLLSLETSSLDILDRLGIEMCMNSLAKIQHQLAVNENCYLTSNVIAAAN